VSFGGQQDSFFHCFADMASIVKYFNSLFQNEASPTLFLFIITEDFPESKKKQAVKERTACSNFTTSPGAAPL
jgi:hypothetical protein